MSLAWGEIDYTETTVKKFGVLFYSENLPTNKVSRAKVLNSPKRELAAYKVW